FPVDQYIDFIFFRMLLKGDVAGRGVRGLVSALLCARKAERENSRGCKVLSFIAHKLIFPRCHPQVFMVRGIRGTLSYCVRYMIVNAPELSGGAEHLRVSAFGKRYINGCVILPGSRCKVGDINGARPVCDRLFAQRSNSTP